MSKPHDVAQWERIQALEAQLADANRDRDVWKQTAPQAQNERDFYRRVMGERGGGSWQFTPGDDRAIVYGSADAIALLQTKLAESIASLHWEDVDDEWTPAIDAAHPTRGGSHEDYATAMRMVGNRHSKGQLVSLVCWLLGERDRARILMGAAQSCLKTTLDREAAVIAERDAARVQADAWGLEKRNLLAAKVAAQREAGKYKAALEALADDCEAIGNSGANDPERKTPRHMLVGEVYRIANAARAALTGDAAVMSGKKPEPSNVRDKALWDLLEKTTPAPWDVTGPYIEGNHGARLVVGPTGVESDWDARFIARARDEVPELLIDLEHAREGRGAKEALRLARELAGGIIDPPKGRPMVKIALELDDALDAIGVASWEEVRKT